MGVDELVMMSFFAEMKMRADGVFEKMNDQVPEQDKKRRALAPHLQTRRDHLDQRRGQHEAGTQSHKVSEVGTFPVFLHDDRAAENIGQRSSETQQNAEKNRVHARGAE